LHQRSKKVSFSLEDLKDEQYKILQIASLVIQANVWGMYDTSWHTSQAKHGASYCRNLDAPMKRGPTFACRKKKSLMLLRLAI
jgi:hypothetical protein